MTAQPAPPPCTREAVVDALNSVGRPLKRWDLIVQMYWHNDGTMLDRVYDLHSGAAVPYVKLINRMVKDDELVFLPGPRWRQILGPDSTPTSVHPGSNYLATKAQYEEWTTPLFTVIGLRMDVDATETMVAAVLELAAPEHAWRNLELDSEDDWTRMGTVVRAKTAREAEEFARAQWAAEGDDEYEVAA
jgi:hypothetical protein